MTPSKPIDGTETFRVPASGSLGEMRITQSAVNLADPLWRVAEAAREMFQRVYGNHTMHPNRVKYCDACVFRAALADLDAKVEETK